jgi:hypothetical protein
VLGTQGIKQFTYVRQRAISKAHDSNSRTKLGEPRGDHFHDGTEVLQDVIYWHNHLRKTCRGTDTITSQMLDLVDHKMLRGNAKERIEASKLCEEMEQILSNSHGATQDSLPESLKEALIQMNEDALSQSSQSKTQPTPASDLLGLNAFQARKTRKFKLLDVRVMATSHRSEALKPKLASLAQPAGYPVASPTGMNDKFPVFTDLPLQHIQPQYPDYLAAKVRQGELVMGGGYSQRSYDQPPKRYEPVSQYDIHNQVYCPTEAEVNRPTKRLPTKPYDAEYRTGKLDLKTERVGGRSSFRSSFLKRLEKKLG